MPNQLPDQTSPPVTPPAGTGGADHWDIRHPRAMRTLLVFAFCTIISAGLSPTGAGGSILLPTGVGGRQPEYGSYNQEQVAALGIALTHVKYPAAEGTIRKLVANSLKPLAVEFVDHYNDQENKGRLGGSVVEYWLNHETTLRIATAYYAVGAKHFNLEEWAVIMTKEERATFSRKIDPY
jgi:hypothetical protein